MVTLKCFNCGTEMTFSSTPGRRDECPKCGADVHSCRNCQHYDRTAYNECREPAADRVQEKDRANFCDYYTPGTAGGPGTDKAKDLRAAADALFKKK
ncbi:MAG: hypothetical protein AAB250_13245 [Bdellovibrionota bacterium]